ncbi:hypothetical protein D3C86_1155200 [compost metagenome]
MADQHADVTAGARLAQTGLQSHPRQLRLHAQGQQKAFVQGQPGANRIQPLRRQALQALHSLTDLFQRPTDFPASLQHPGTVVVRQCFEQGVADPLRQLQRFAVQSPCPPQIAVGNGEVGQGRKAHQALAVTLGRKTFQRFAAVPQRQFAVAASTGNDAAQRQPLSEHRLLCGGRRSRQETAQMAGQLFGGIQLASHPQRPAIEHDQPRRADQQAVRQVHFPAQQHADILLGQQLLFGEVLHQVRRDVQVTGAQGLLHGLIEQSLGIEPAAGTQVQAGGRHHRLGSRARAQQIGKQVMVTIPVAVLVQRHQEHLVGEQEAQDFAAVMGVANGIAQFAAKTLLGRRVVEERLDLGGQAIDDLFEQVIADQPFPAVQRLRQRAIGARLRGGQQPEA